MSLPEAWSGTWVPCTKPVRHKRTKDRLFAFLQNFLKSSYQAQYLWFVLAWLSVLTWWCSAGGALPSHWSLARPCPSADRPLRTVLWWHPLQEESFACFSSFFSGRNITEPPLRHHTIAITDHNPTVKQFQLSFVYSKFSSVGTQVIRSHGEHSYIHDEGYPQGSFLMIFILGDWLPFVSLMGHSYSIFTF